MTKEQALKEFRGFVLPTLRWQYESNGQIDKPARRESWNNYTVFLCNSGQITLKQYESWSNPF